MRLDNPLQDLYNRIKVVAFTGTRQGLTEAQCESLRQLLKEISPRRLIHGDCIGGDAMAHEIAEDLGIKTVTRPCNLRGQRAFTGAEALAEPEDPLVRNRKMVDESHALIGCPSSKQQELRSGTWATIRYAKKMDGLVWLVFPDGSIQPPSGL